MQPLTVLFFGSQGAGKGTQVKRLVEFLQAKSEHTIIHIDMGLLLRELVSAGSYSGKLTAEVIEPGHRMSDFMPIYLQTKKLVENFTGEEHIIADGLARGEDQTRAFDDAMKFYKRENYHIISIHLSEESSIKRLLLRGRNDDTESGIRNRLAWMKTDVLPQLEFLKKRGRVAHEIDGEPDVETIHKNILSVLGLAG
ncbi:MAG: Adenylate kinase [Candidatus Kaiserbacteria bacterium GW2011_GWC2_52_8b]|uniref:Adenylate kinase n=2 Tax=Candidatus Kaiseribacteriota TaxID=1752734 RepID=A0A0G1XFE2_9BACT|nr:MAG: Adenylate kinase [Candidatus Kaiserbacteria bacterium GW2011_GWA2_52_12]KKW29600.1 MAG: Adenylate kinase [Candidatus Kaiserbacteria bacterium GW2011_GWC2_52_8b]